MFSSFLSMRKILKQVSKWKRIGRVRNTRGSDKCDPGSNPGVVEQMSAHYIWISKVSTSLMIGIIS